MNIKNEKMNDKGLLESLVLPLKLRHQRRKLRQIGAECDGKYADARFGFN